VRSARGDDLGGHSERVDQEHRVNQSAQCDQGDILRAITIARPRKSSVAARQDGTGAVIHHDHRNEKNISWQQKAGEGGIIRQDDPYQYYRSKICTPVKHKAVIKGLGFTRLNQVVERVDTPSIRGMVKKVPHLVEIVKG